MQPHTTPSVGGGGSGWSAAASPTTLTGTAPAIRARRSRGARPRSTATVSAGVVVSTPVASAVTTARTRPPSPSNRTRSWSTATTRPRSTPAVRSRSAARAVTIPASRLPGHDRMDLGGARRDDDLARMDVEHAVGRADHDHRPGVDRDDLLAGMGVEDADGLARPLRLGGRGEPAGAAADDRDVHLEMVQLDRDRERRGRQIRGGHHGERRHRLDRMPGDPQSRAGGGLARPDVGGAVDLGETVAAIAGEAQRAAPPGDLAAAQDRDRDRIARLERDRPPVDDDPPAARRRAPGVPPR